MQTLIFLLAVINSALMIAVFIVRKKQRLDIVRRLGYIYLALAVPAAAALAIAVIAAMALHITFLCIYLGFIALEFVYDFWLRLDFRTNWKLLVPYLALYYASCYGLFVMVYKSSAPLGIAVLALTVLQIAVNIWSHPRRPKQ
ncbi:MAG: hypothetical protein PHO15_06035 [Eubacteriales bacterium]|nr:hypothetical protein [Eubacteriales bacterium]